MLVGGTLHKISIYVTVFKREEGTRNKEIEKQDNNFEREDGRKNALN